VTGTVSEDRKPPIPFLARIEEGVLALVLGAMVLLPVISVASRLLRGKSIAVANVWVQNLNLVLAFVGAVIAARTMSHLSLSTGELFKLDPTWQARIARVTSAVAVAITALLAYASYQFVRAEMTMSSAELPGGIPAWVIQASMPIGFAGVAAYMAWVGNPDWKGRLLSLGAAVAVFSLAWVPEGERTWVVYGGGAVLLTSVALGAPIYTVMGGMAMLLFYGQELPTPIAAVPVETINLVTDPNLPAIPLFTLAGYLLAEGGASKRLVAVFEQWFGWMPGGIAAATVLVCAFFTTFTGASGVTILALGALLLPILKGAGYDEKFSIGLLVASGSIGLLFPPSLPVILYGVVAQVPIDKMFMSGAVPGLVLCLLLVGMGMWHAHRRGVTRNAFALQPALSALWAAKWEAAMPVLVLVGIFGGFLTIFEAAACTALYAFVSEVVVHRDLKGWSDIRHVLVSCGTLMGGVLIILGLALGLTNFLVDAEVPMRVSAWVGAHVANKLVFLLLLNLLLLVVGCLMDIFSAIVVVVPLIVPMAAVFGVNPIHLGIIFLANLELGYLTPPVGMNLFLASYRFDKPLTEVYRMALPFLGILVGGVLLITYVPALTLWPHEDPNAGSGIDFEGELDKPSAGDETPAMPLGNLDLGALLADDDDSATGGPAEPVTPAPKTLKPGELPLGNLDLDALLSDDDDSTESP
jgi:C4-dicarboxylate transporter DctM subunit